MSEPVGHNERESEGTKW